MSKGIQKTLVVFFALVIGITIGLIQNNAHAIELIEVATDGICGNGVREAGEQCDHGADNGTEGDLCLADCKWDLENVEQECIEEKFKDCFKPEIVPDGELELEEVAVEAAPLEQGIEKIDAPEDNSLEECIEWAIEECRDDPEEPEETPEVEEEEEGKAIEPAQPLFFEGSGGCTLGSAAAGPQSLGLLLGLGFGIVPLFGRRFKK